MQNNNDDDFVCPKCGNEVEEDDDFCPYCGVIFAEGVICDQHSQIEADGVCVVCASPCCDECGTMVKDLFLCNRRCKYEIYEGMVRVYGSYDDGEAEYAKSLLEEAGLHPVEVALANLSQALSHQVN